MVLVARCHACVLERGWWYNNRRRRVVRALRAVDVRRLVAGNGHRTLAKTNCKKNRREASYRHERTWFSIDCVEEGCRPM